MIPKSFSGSRLATDETQGEATSTRANDESFGAWLLNDLSEREREGMTARDGIAWIDALLKSKELLWLPRADWSNYGSRAAIEDARESIGALWHLQRVLSAHPLSEVIPNTLGMIVISPHHMHMVMRDPSERVARSFHADLLALRELLSSEVKR